MFYRLKYSDLFQSTCKSTYNVQYTTEINEKILLSSHFLLYSLTKLKINYISICFNYVFPSKRNFRKITFRCTLKHHTAHRKLKSKLEYAQLQCNISIKPCCQSNYFMRGCSMR